MTALKWVLVLVLVGYGGVVALMYFAQRALMYFPDKTRISPDAVGLPQAEQPIVQTEDGERLILWHVPAREEKPVVIYFQGNGGGLDLRADRFRRLVSDGTGLIAVNYRGYGGSTGQASEAGLLRDAVAAYDFARGRYAAERIVLWGESLGTGAAVALAAERPVARVLLESPYTSIADVAASLYWFIPVRLLLKDQFHSDERIAKVTAPVLVLHGARDRIVPIVFGERLFALIPRRKRFIRLPEAEHNDHEKFGALELVRPFLLGRE